MIIMKNHEKMTGYIFELKKENQIQNETKNG